MQIRAVRKSRHHSLEESFKLSFLMDFCYEPVMNFCNGNGMIGSI